MGKLNNVERRHRPRRAQILAGDGVTTEFSVMRHLANLEAVPTCMNADDVCPRHRRSTR